MVKLYSRGDEPICYRGPLCHLPKSNRAAELFNHRPIMKPVKNEKFFNSSNEQPKIIGNQSINQFSGPAYPWGVAGAAAQVGASKHLDPLQQRIDALLGCQGETN